MGPTANKKGVKTPGKAKGVTKSVTKGATKVAKATAATRPSAPPPAPAAALLKIGAKAPAFTLPRDGGGQVALSDFKGRKLALYFYPKADTPGCTRESIAFSALRKAFEKAGTAILGVSADPVKKQERFIQKHDLAIPLGSDETHAMLEAYGVWAEKSMYGRTFWGVVRTTVLIDAQGRIARVWPKVSVEGHAEEVLAAAEAL